MKRFKEYQEQAKVHELVMPEKEVCFHAYRDGKLVATKPTKPEALEYSSIVEEIDLNLDERREMYALIRQRDSEAFTAWKKDLYAQYDLPDKVLDICYDHAYDRAHAYGYDEVASYMSDEVDFAERLLKAARGEYI